jgi:DNA-binding GntR family transcriptional regulator
MEATWRIMKIQPISSGWIKVPVRLKKTFSVHGGITREGLIGQMTRLLIDKTEPRRKLIFDCYLPAWLIKKIGFDDLKNSPFHEKIAKVTGLRAVEIEETIRPWLCSEEDAKWLGLVAGTPLFYNTRVFLMKDGRVLFVLESRSTINALVNKIDFT